MIKKSIKNCRFQQKLQISVKTMDFGKENSRLGENHDFQQGKTAHFGRKTEYFGKNHEFW